MLSIHLELEDCFVDGKVGWRPLSYPSADPHFDRHTNYCEDDMINIVRLRITLLMVMVLTLIWDRSVGMVVLVMIIAKIILYWWFS